ncbi:MAG: methyltransferase [Bacteroidaceae bacterium]|nr:methyltransferase [Bacteroidaceae bacterium]
MSNQHFDFKRFRIEQDRCSMKVGTDGVLLGAWFNLEPGMSVLDIGTGTGLIALMAAQRGAGSVTAVEIDPDAAGQALENVRRSEWADRIEVINADIALFTARTGFDRIVCNPPYFRDSLRCPDAGRNTARHNDSLSFETLVRCSASLLAPDGLLCLVMPFDAVSVFTKCAALAGLYLCRRTDLVTAPGKTPKRSLLASGKQSDELQSDTLSICGPDGKETSEYVNLVNDFYLKY